MALVGEETVTIRKHSKDGHVEEQTKVAQICNIKFYLANFSQNTTSVGEFLYHFKMQAPVWLPESVNLSRDECSVKISYNLQAAYSPIEYQVWQKEIFVFNPVRIKPAPTFEYTIKSTIGGMMGFGQSTSETKVTFPTNVFEAG